MLCTPNREETALKLIVCCTSAAAIRYISVLQYNATSYDASCVWRMLHICSCNSLQQFTAVQCYIICCIICMTYVALLQLQFTTVHCNTSHCSTLLHCMLHDCTALHFYTLNLVWCCMIHCRSCRSHVLHYTFIHCSCTRNATSFIVCFTAALHSKAL